MYGRLSLREFAYAMLAMVTLLFAIFTVIIFQSWRIDTAGVWGTGTVTSITHCVSSKGQTLSTVHLEITFTDAHGQRHRSQSQCENDTYSVGESLTIRYLPDDPSSILLKDEIGSGYGSTLATLLVLDALCLPLVIFFTVRAVRKTRQDWAMRAEQRRQWRASQSAQRAERQRQPKSYRRQTATSRRARRALAQSAQTTKRPPTRA